MATGTLDLGTLLVRLASDATELLDGYNKAEKQSKKVFSEITKQAALMSAAVTASLAALGAASVKTFSDMEKEVFEASQRMGNTSTALRKEMEATARQVAKDSASSVNELSKAYSDLAYAGYDAKQSIAALAQIEETSSATAMTLSQSVQTLTGVQSSLGLVSKDAAKNLENLTRVSDVLVAAAKNSRGNIQEFATSLSGNAGVAMRELGVSLEEGAALLAAWSDQGYKGAEAGQKLSMILGTLQEAALENSTEFQKLGIQIFNAQGNLVPLSKITEQLKARLGNLSTAQQRLALETLGFNQKLIPAVQSLAQAGDAVKQYEAILQTAAGTTRDLAAKETEIFAANVDNLWNRIKDLLITIGEGLVPALVTVVEVIVELINTSDEVQDVWGIITNYAAPALLAAIGLIGDAIRGWKLIIKTGETVFLGFTSSVLDMFDYIVKAINTAFEKLVNYVVEGVNAAIRALNKLLPKAKEVTEIKWRLEIDKTNGITEWAQAMTEAWHESQQELTALAEAPSFSTKVIQVYDKVLRKQGERVATGVKEIASNVKKAFAETERQVAIEVDKITRDSNYVMEALRKMKEPEKDPSGRKLVGLGNEDVNAAYQISEELKDAEANLATLEYIHQQELQLTQEANAKKIEMMEAYAEKVKALQYAIAETVLKTSETMFSDLTEIAKNTAGEQSKVYKAMFAASKAFAIAEAIVKIQQGVANAASLTWPANLVAMGSVVAATSSIVSTIRSVQLEFGGGKADGGPVRPGYFYEINERGQELFAPTTAGSIIPNEQLTGGRQAVNVVVNNYTDAKATVTEKEKDGERFIEVVIQRTQKEIAAGIRDGRGDVTRAMEGTYNVRRAQ